MDMQAIKELGEKQEDFYNANGVYPKDCVSFVSKHGTDILNPFKSECLRSDIEPVEYYGKLFLDSKFCRIAR